MSFALSTIALAVGFPYFSNKSFSNEPAFTPILIGIFFSLHLSTTAFTLSSAPIFPGLILTLSTPELIASNAIL